MKRFLQLILITFTLIACSSTKEVHTKKETIAIQKEHVVTYKDTTFTVPAQTASLRIPREFVTIALKSTKDSTEITPRTFTNVNGRSKVKVVIDALGVTATSNCDSIALRVQIKQELIKEFYSNKSIENSKIEKSKGVSIFKLVIYCISFLTVGAVAGYLIKLLNII